MTGQMRFSKQAHSGNATRAWELMPNGGLNGMECHASNKNIEKFLQTRKVRECQHITPQRLHYPFTTGRIHDLRGKTPIANGRFPKP